MLLFLQKILKIISKLILSRHKPTIIGITGSMGKTSTVQAVYQVLVSKFRVRKTIGNYNNELGVPLTIIGQKSAGKSILGWLEIFIKGFLQIFKSKYPEILILEMGIDKPGDLDYLLNLVKPNISILTAIGKIPVHIEFFKNPEELAKEKIKIIKCLNSNNTAILNFDDLKVRSAKKETQAKIITFGFNKGSEIFADNLILNSPELGPIDQPQGYSFKLHYQGKEIPIRLPYVFGKHQIYAVLAAVACGLALDMNLVEISQSLTNYKPPNGRMNLIPGIKYTYLIDDTYNSSPDASIAALNVLKQLQVPGKKIAVLGDMLELGAMTEQAHKDIGKIAAQTTDIIVAVGKASKYTASEAIEFGFPQDKVFQFQESSKAGLFIQNKILSQGDLVLIKGSQGIRMEKITKELMAEPEKAKELLVRQSSDWL